MSSVPALEISQVGSAQWDQCLCGLPIAPDGLVSPRGAGGTATGLRGACERVRPPGPRVSCFCQSAPFLYFSRYFAKALSYIIGSGLLRKPHSDNTCHLGNS